MICTPVQTGIIKRRNDMTLEERVYMMEAKLQVLEARINDKDDEIYQLTDEFDAFRDEMETRISRMEGQVAMDEEDLDWIFKKVCRKEDHPEVGTRDWWEKMGFAKDEISECDIYDNCEDCPKFDDCFEEVVIEDDGGCPADCDEDCECCGCEEEDCDECEVYLQDQERQCSDECREDCTTCYWAEGTAYEEMEAYMDALRFKGL